MRANRLVAERVVEGAGDPPRGSGRRSKAVLVYMLWFYDVMEGLGERAKLGIVMRLERSDA